MARIIHLEDEKPFQLVVRSALKDVKDLNLTQVGDLESFFLLNNINSDLYILDRHFPEKVGGKSGDKAWRRFSMFVKEYYPETPIIILSSAIPDDWRRYSYKTLTTFV